MLATYQNQPFAWTTGSIVAVSGQSFTQANQQVSRDNLSATSFPAYAGSTITVSGWVNTLGLVGHPTGDGHAYTGAIGVLVRTTSGGQLWLPAASLASGSDWTLLTGTVTVPANAAAIQPWAQIEKPSTDTTYSIMTASVACSLSFNGWQILPMPTSPIPMQLDMEISDTVGKVQSPFTLDSQYQVWPGAESWTCNVSLPPMSRAKADGWVAWMMSLQGILNTFQMGDASHAVPQGNPSGYPLVDGSNGAWNLPKSFVLHTKGWTPNRGNLLVAGDYIQLGVRVHRVTQPVSSDANGNAVVNLWPSIRELPGDGQLVIVSGTQGLWRLVDNKRQWTERPTKQLGLAFKIVEAR